MKVKEFLKPFAGKTVFNLRGELHPAIELIDNYGDFEVVSIDSSPNIRHPKLVIDEPTCDCYHIKKERHYLTEYEKGYYYGKQGKELTYIDKEIPVCYGTKEIEECSCGGYRSQCNFYREKFMKELKNEEKSK